MATKNDKTYKDLPSLGFNWNAIAENIKKPTAPALPNLNVDWENVATTIKKPTGTDLPKITTNPTGLTNKGLVDSGQATYNSSGGITGTGSNSSTSINPRSGVVSIPRLSSAESATLAKSSGLSGLVDDNAFRGLTNAEAKKKAEQIKQEKMQDVSALTSFTYNPESIQGFNKTLKDLQLRVGENKNDPFGSKQSKTEKQDNLINSYVESLANQFGTTEAFKAAQQNPEFQRMLQQYSAMGGTVNDIEASLSKKEQGTGGLSPYYQQTDDYLASLTEGDPAAGAAYESLIAENMANQQRINFEQMIPNEYRDAYYGTPEAIGILEQQKREMDEAIKLKEKQLKMEERNLKAKARLESEKLDFEMQKDALEVEDNRLAAKNYMTERLASLGALKTTGAAPVALANLEQKYQRQSQELKTSYGFVKQDLTNQLNESLDNLTIKFDNDVFDLKQDLSKSSEDVWKEIFKLQQNADRETLKITDSFAKDFRTQREKYKKEMTAAAKKYTSDFSNTVSDLDLVSFEQFLAPKQEAELMSFGQTRRGEELSQYIQQILDQGLVSSTTAKVLTKESNIGDYSAATQAKIKADLRKMNLSEEELSSVMGNFGSESESEEVVKDYDSLF
jgi:hypothetical protein